MKVQGGLPAVVSLLPDTTSLRLMERKGSAFGSPNTFGVQG